MIVSAKKLKKGDILYVSGRGMTVRKVKKTKRGLIISLALRGHEKHHFKFFVPKHYTVRTSN